MAECLSEDYINFVIEEVNYIPSCGSVKPVTPLTAAARRSNIKKLSPIPAEELISG